MRIRLAVPGDLDGPEQAAALDAALEAVTRANETDLRARRVPIFARALRAGRVRWRPEPPGDEHFDGARTVMRRGWGDCDDLAPWHAASLRVTGSDPGARAIVRRSGPRRWHAIVRHSDGSIADPSEAAGMRTAVVAGAMWAPMVHTPEGYPGAAVAVHPWGPGWAARADLPWPDAPIALSGVATGRDPGHALRRAIRASCAAGADDACELARVRMGALHDVLAGEDPEQVAEALDHAGVGFLPLAPMAASLAAPLATSIVPGLFGGGGKRGAAAAPAAPGAIPSGGGMAPGTTLTMPGGPIIVRF